ncbi:hypothetical protein BDA96_03G065900 [Sorghum bicolor]|uniref:DOG1 domain-containing protein n=1 Tax=Sorghum bicolor TaxID=4558 RepID=A0A921RB21_SORBI|nr:hypothetical protein BDA96_03G065900 [Sorghum bicolor]
MPATFPPPPPPPPPSHNLPPLLSSNESFSKFFESWIGEQSRDLEELRAAASAEPAAPEADLRRLVDQVMGHYAQYYSTKAAAAAGDVSMMFTPSWTSTTENLYLWCGGWRPTAAIQLLYTKSGMQLEHRLPVFLDGGGLNKDDLSDLSVAQLRAADQLQHRTISREREIEEVAATAQEALTSKTMVELAGGGGGGGGGGMDAGAMDREMQTKAEGMRQVLEMADGLRLETMREVVALLRPAQAVHFLLAAAELHLAVHDFGRRKDGHAGNAAAAAAPPE